MAGKDLPKGSEYRYYIHPKDKHTNDTLAQLFEESGFRVCSDEKERFFFDTKDHSLIAYIQRSRKEMNLNFQVFIQKNRGKIRPWPFDAASKKKRFSKKKAA